MKKHLISILLLISLMTFTYACGEVGEQDSIPAPPQDSTSQESQSDSWEDISSGTSSEDNSSEDSLDSSSDENETEILPW